MTEKMPRILIVITSCDRIGDTEQKTGFWLEELASPYYVFVDAGADVTLASIKGGEPPLDPTSELPESQTEATERFMADDDAKKRLKQTLAIADAQVDDYDAIFLPGGHGTMWDFPNSAILTQLIEGFDRAQKAISAVCHAPAALVSVKSASGEPLVKGRTITAFTDSEERAVQLDKIVPFLLETRLRELGGNFTAAADFELNVEQDGHLITGQNPASSQLVAQRVLEFCS